MKRKITWPEVQAKLSVIDESWKGQKVYGVPKGGMILTAYLKNCPAVIHPDQADFILDDLVDSGATKRLYAEKYPLIPFVVLFDKEKEQINDWLIFPWESDHPQGEDNIQQNITRMLEYLGEDIKREGLVETPNRVVRSWDELFAGYKQKPASLMTVFKKETYDQIVILKNIEMYSMCEHHMLPFFGKAHVAYIPDKHVIGISKLARLVDIYARRLQIQERIGEQVTQALMEYLKPIGAACVIEAEHMCMRMRGVSKQESTMVTSSLKGAFLTSAGARIELMGLIK